MVRQNIGSEMYRSNTEYHLVSIILVTISNRIFEADIDSWTFKNELGCKLLSQTRGTTVHESRNIYWSPFLVSDSAASILASVVTASSTNVSLGE